MNISQWQHNFCRIGHDLAGALAMRKIDDVVRAKLEPAIRASREFSYYLNIAYQSQLTMTLRRQCTCPTDTQGISLKKLLLELKKEPERRSLLRRTFLAEAKRVASDYPEGGSLRAFYSLGDPNGVFDNFSGGGNEVLEPSLIQQDVDRLDALYAPLSAYADKEHAHLEKRSVDSPRFPDANLCLDGCWDLCRKYHTLFFAKPHMSEVGVGPEERWEERFEKFEVKAV